MFPFVFRAVYELSVFALADQGEVEKILSDESAPPSYNFDDETAHHCLQDPSSAEAIIDEYASNLNSLNAEAHAQSTSTSAFTNQSTAPNDIQRYCEQLAQYGYALRTHALCAVHYAQKLTEWHRESAIAPVPYNPAAAWPQLIAPTPPLILADQPAAPRPQPRRAPQLRHARALSTAAPFYHVTRRAARGDVPPYHPY